MEERFGTFISIAAFIQAPIIGMSFADYILIRKRKLSLKSAYFLKDHHAYDYNCGFNVIGLACVLIACVTTILFVYNPIEYSAVGVPPVRQGVPFVRRGVPLAIFR